MARPELLVANYLLVGLANLNPDLEQVAHFTLWPYY
jgi:hypothetical protein